MTRLPSIFVLLALMTFCRTITAEVEAPRVERIDAERVVVIWSAPAAVDVYAAEHPGADIGAAKLVAKDNRDGRQTAAAPDHSRSFFLLRDSSDGAVTVVSERLLPLERASNFRDIGGYAAGDGRRVRWGWIYRSGATPLLSDRDMGYVRALGIRAMIDLRSVEERELAPTRLANQGIEYLTVDYSFKTLLEQSSPAAAAAASPSTGSVYYPVLTLLAPQYRTLFGELLAHEAPLSYNCTAGQDRTGVATALILSALGVPRETIIQDYHLSTSYRLPENEMPPIDPADFPDNAVAGYSARARTLKPNPLYSKAGRSQLAEMFDAIDARWGSVEHYLEQMLDIGAEELATLRDLYLE